MMKYYKYETNYTTAYIETDGYVISIYVKRGNCLQFHKGTMQPCVEITEAEYIKETSLG